MVADGRYVRVRSDVHVSTEGAGGRVAAAGAEDHLLNRRSARLAANLLGVRAIVTGLPSPAGHHPITIDIPLAHHVVRRLRADDAVVVDDVVPVPAERF